MMYAVLFITVVLTISMGILTVALRQFSVSGISKESPRALYAADAGLECAFYAEAFSRYFSTTSPMNDQTYAGLCDTNNIRVRIANPNPTPPATLTWDVIEVRFGLETDLVCAKVSIKKNVDATGHITLTTIDSRGYNTECPGTTPKRLPLVERGLTATY